TGTGLGLTVVYAIVQEHGGRVRLEATPGTGASFYVELPVTAAQVPTARPYRTPLATGDRPTKSSILIVEDETALAAAVAEALRDAGYDVERAVDGEDALVKVGGRTFDAVVCDLKMPRLDGQAFYRTLTSVPPVLAKQV